ncbi:hypothetical protein JCM33374_g4734 [Metschnikowia sp. JCM 33374]|nr:hypothetical protein JCM33374_g4734 [Metschnikowia sp. JCM 33374]
MRLLSSVLTTLIISSVAHSLPLDGNSHIEQINAFSETLVSEEDGLGDLHQVIAHNGDALQAEKSLNDVYAYLTSFLKDSSFSRENFDWVAEQIDRELKDISRTLMVANPGKSVLSDRLTYAKFLFELMVDTSESLKSFGPSDPTCVHLVHCIIELRLIIRALYNAEGSPDREIPAYAYKVYQFMGLLEFLRVEFERLKTVPFGVRHMFNKHFSGVEYTLRVLESYIEKKGE